MLGAVATNKVDLYGKSYVAKGGTRLMNKAKEEREFSQLMEQRDKERREKRVA